MRVVFIQKLLLCFFGLSSPSLWKLFWWTDQSLISFFHLSSSLYGWVRKRSLIVFEASLMYFWSKHSTWSSVAIMNSNVFATLRTHDSGVDSIHSCLLCREATSSEFSIPWSLRMEYWFLRVSFAISICDDFVNFITLPLEMWIDWECVKSVKTASTIGP